MEAEPHSAPPKRKRRWFQFRLRTLMIAVTLLAVPCAYVGWQAKIVRQRKSLLDSIQSPDWYAEAPNHSEDSEPPPDQRTVPRIRTWLGDRPIVFIFIRESNPNKDAMVAAFPEADVQAYR
jgi:hypothetical protein